MTVTILELRKLKREALAEQAKREADAARARFGADYRPSHVAQEQARSAPALLCAACALVFSRMWWSPPVALEGPFVVECLSRAPCCGGLVLGEGRAAVLLRRQRCCSLLACQTSMHGPLRGPACPVIELLVAVSLFVEVPWGQCLDSSLV